jgi:hypothetical protein
MTLKFLILLVLGILSPLAYSQENDGKSVGEQFSIIKGRMMLEPGDVGGVLPLLLTVAGYAALERSSDSIESSDLLKALYVVDLEHISAFYRNWQDLETLVTKQGLTGGNSGRYLNRTLYLVEAHKLPETSSGSLLIFGQASDGLRRIVYHARKFAADREQTPATPTSKDLLLSIILNDPKLGAELKTCGIQMEFLSSAVQGKPR